MNKRQAFMGLLLGTAMAVSAQPLASWTKYRTITVNTTAGGANVAGNVTNIPILVRLNATNAADVFAQALPGGADIRFSNAAGTAMVPFEIEHWDATAQKAAIWVLAGTVTGNNNTASLRMYWGRPGTAGASNSAAVFDTTNGFVSVWHMNGDSAETDVTSNRFVASPTVAPGTNDTAAIGKGRRFNGTQYLRAVGTASSALNLAMDASYTLSAWVYSDSVVPTGGTGHGVVNKGDHQWTLATYSGSGNRWYEITTKAGNNQWRQTTTQTPNLPQNADVGTWKYLTGTWVGSPTATATGRIYLDGVLRNTATFNNSSTAGRQEARDVHIGALSNEGTGSVEPTGSMERFWIGSLDEIRVSKVARDSNWIRLSFETQKPTASAVALGATQTQAVTVTAITGLAWGDSTKGADTVVWYVGVPVNLAPTYNGGPVDSFAITSGQTSLPAGITFNKLTGVFSGTPTATSNAGNRTITAYSSAGNVTRVVRRSAVVAPQPTADFDYAFDTTVYVVGIPGEANSPSFTGSTPTSYSVAPALPAGLSLNTTTGVISGSPTAAGAAANYTVTATSALNTVTKVIRISAVSAASENYANTSFPNKQVIYLNTQGNGATVSGGVSNFPVLIRLDSSNFNTGFTQAAAGGADIRFTKVNNTTRLSHQIERWDATAKKAEIWVRLDTIRGNAIDSLRMHWGNPTAPSLSSGPTVFDTATGFQAVWHMNAPSGAESDATPNGFGAAATAAPGTGAGIIGPARTFNGTSQFFSVPGTATGKLNFTQADSYTLSAWINPAAIATATNTGHKIIDKGDNQYVLATYGPDEASRYWEITIRGNGAWNQCQADGSFAGAAAILASSSTNAWNHLVGTYAGGPVGGTGIMQRLYYNGVLVNECPVTNDSPDGRNEGHIVHLGVQSGTPPSGNYTRYWNGLIDEPRMHSRARSGDWVKLEFQNQRAAQTLVSFTKPTSISGNPAASMLGQGFSVRAAGQGLVFQLQAAHEGKAVMSLVDMYGRTVWSGAFAPGSSRLQWNGSARGGHGVSSGIYVARLTLLNPQGKAVQVMDRKVPYTR